jgi:hypothetical protein
MPYSVAVLKIDQVSNLFTRRNIGFGVGWNYLNKFYQPH